MVYLITGKAGAGKSTYACNLALELRDRGENVSVLDSEQVREETGRFDYSQTGRENHLFCLALSAAVEELRGNTVIVSAISPTKDLRFLMRSLWKKSFVVYIPGGSLWLGTVYEPPDEEELKWLELPLLKSSRYLTTAL